MYIFFPIFLFVRAIMKLTLGALRALRCGAETGRDCINAVDSEGVEWEAPQILAKDDKNIRLTLNVDEYKPILEVTKREWLGKYLLKQPVIRFHVTDGSDDDDMVMFISMRDYYRHSKGLMAKSGPFQKGRFNVGCRFQLADYTTHVNVDKRMCNVGDAMVLVERIRAEPRSSHQKKLTSFLSKNRVSGAT